MLPKKEKNQRLCIPQYFVMFRGEWTMQDMHCEFKKSKPPTITREIIF